MAGRSRRQVCRASSGATADFYFTDFAPWKHLYISKSGQGVAKLLWYLLPFVYLDVVIPGSVIY